MQPWHKQKEGRWIAWALILCSLTGQREAAAQTLEPSLLVPAFTPQREGKASLTPNDPLRSSGFGMAFGAPFSGEKISLNFQQIELRALLQVIADFTQINLIASDAVTGSTTVRLMNVPWDQALDIVLESKGMGSRRQGNVIWVAPKDEWLQREKQALENQTTLQALAPLNNLAITLQYAKAGDVAQRLMPSGLGGGPGGARWLSARGTLMVEPRTNQLFITDVPAHTQVIQAMIAKLDVPVRQVLIEARIVEADDQFGKSLGVRLGAGFATPLSLLGKPLNATVGGTVNPSRRQYGEPASGRSRTDLERTGQRGHVLVQCDGQPVFEHGNFCLGGRRQRQNRLQPACGDG